MRSWTTAIVIAVLLGLLAADAMAQGPPDRGPRPPRFGGSLSAPGRYGTMRMPPSPLMGVLDADKDGELSADEIKKAAAAVKKLDRNKDGKLSREELRPMFTPGQRPEPRPAIPGRA